MLKTWEVPQSQCLSLSFPKLPFLILPTRIIETRPQLTRYVTTVGIRTTLPCLPLVAGVYSHQHHPLVVGVALRAVVVVARLSDALSVQ